MNTVVQLPFSSPPLSLNQRLHWAAKARLSRTVRDVTHAAAKAANLTPVEAATVTLHYRQKVQRPIDKDNLMATIKPAIDGLRDAGVLVEDDSTRVDPRVEVHPAIAGQPGAIWLTIEAMRP